MEGFPLVESVGGKSAAIRLTRLKPGHDSPYLLSLGGHAPVIRLIPPSQDVYNRTPKEVLSYAHEHRSR